ncbi:MAG: VWA domain-containing protein [Acidobacteriota bacterium]
MSLDHPILALLLFGLLAAGTVLTARRSRALGSRARQGLAVVLRCALWALLILALCGLRWQRLEEGVATIFVVDWSESTEGIGRERAREFLEQARETAQVDDLSAIVQFGGDALVESSLRPVLGPPLLASTPLGGSSRLEPALQLASGLLPQGGRRRVLVLTDGELDGEPAESLSALAATGVDVGLVSMGRQRGPENLIEEVRAPEFVREGAPFEVSVLMASNTEASGVLRVTRNGELIGTRAVQLAAGEVSLLRFQEVDLPPGRHLYRAHLDASPDGRIENDSAEALVRVTGRSRVLVIDPEPERLASLQRLLDGEDVDATIAGLSALPQDLTEAAAVDVLVLSDVDSLSLSTAQMRMLRAAVRQGGGLMMVGGPRSFGPGGWYRTPVEEVLPVDCEVRTEKFYPSLSLISVLDKSGSMGGAAGASKMDLAKEAASQAIELLHAGDRAGVIAFDSAAKWVVPMSDVDDKKALIRQVGTLRQGGGTDAYPGLELAHEALSSEDTALKHVILLSDGQTPPRNFQALLTQMRSEAITVSTVAVGTDADLYTLQRLAKWGGGRYHFTDDPASVPRIFTKEAFTAGRSFVVEEPFVPKQVRVHPVLPAGSVLPGVGGYVASTAKPAAEVLLTSHRDEPVLALQRFGLGRSAALTTDFGQRWATSWVDDAAARGMVVSVLRWLGSRRDSPRLHLRLRRADDRLHVEVEARDESEDYLNFADLRAEVVGPDLEVHGVTLRQVAPGRYEGDVLAEDSGAYLVGVSQLSGDKLVRSTTGARVFPYSAEYRLPRRSDALASISSLSGASIVTDPATAFARSGEAGRRLSPAWPDLLRWAALLLLLDVACRRLLLPDGWLAKLKGRFAGRSAETAADGEGLSRLAVAKQRSRGAAARVSPSTAPSAMPPPPSTPSERDVELPPVEPKSPPPPAPRDDDPPPPAPSEEGGTSRLLKAKRRARR